MTINTFLLFIQWSSLVPNGISRERWNAMLKWLETRWDLGDSLDD